MRRKFSWPIIAVFCAALFLLSFSRELNDRIRGTALSLFFPLWEKISSTGHNSKQEGLDLRLEQLVLENQLLKNEIAYLQEHGNPELENLFSLNFEIVPARVIFRPLSEWDNVLWINVGELTNEQLGKNVIQKNSPVIVKKSVVGMIDYVGKKQSRVRLITSSTLSPSVRVCRKIGDNTCFLAKGELQGGAKQMSSHEFLLRGTGFNYDFSDKEGPARDLRTGQVEGKGKGLPIIKKGDLLVTSGLDGVFPKGLYIATVQRIYPLKEGDYYFDIEARPTVEGLDHLSQVFVIQPIGFSHQDFPR